ncbi:MAG: site-2 protease family protein [Gemmatimonadaceae bacterium]
MKWAARIGVFSGIALYVHVTFILLVVWVGYAHWQAEQSVWAVAAGIFFILALFTCVVLHEFGHALTARRFGIGTRDIILLPIGGVARLERMPEDPRQELLVALAGPAVNAVIALVLYVGLRAVGGMSPIGELTLTGGSFLERMMVINVVLATFNLLPAFPMDGGRVVRALLAMRMNYARATRLAARLGQAVALVFGILGFFGSPFLVLIAVFVWIGAAQESAATQMKFALGHTTAESVMVSRFRTLAPDDTLDRAVELLLSDSQQDFPVVEGTAVVGVLTRAALLAALASDGKSSRIDSVMQRDFRVADVEDYMENVLEQLQGCSCRTVPVLRSGMLVGLVTMENVGEFLSVQAALHKTVRT